MSDKHKNNSFVVKYMIIHNFISNSYYIQYILYQIHDHGMVEITWSPHSDTQYQINSLDDLCVLCELCKHEVCLCEHCVLVHWWIVCIDSTVNGVYMCIQTVFINKTCLFQGDIEGVSAEANDRKVRGTNSTVNYRNSWFQVWRLSSSRICWTQAVGFQQ